jgi:aryl-alcohol dehydrogenase-like predicted oxidoreductase
MTFCLGAANFGSKYGISNTKKISKLNSSKLINYFLKKKQNYIDTAEAYKGSNLHILQHLKKISLREKKNINIITKVKYKFKKKNNYLVSRAKFNLSYFKIKKLYGYLLHDLNFDKNKTNLKMINEQFKIIKKKKYSKKTGISVYSLKDFYFFQKNIPEINLVQCPTNIFDLRFLNKKFINFCNKNKIEIHYRSLFLQGLLMTKKIPTSIKSKKIINMLESYKNYLDKNNFSRVEIVIKFIKLNFNKNIKWVLGFENLNQTKTFFDLFNRRNSKKFKNIKLDYLYLKNKYIDTRNWKCISF